MAHRVRVGEPHFDWPAKPKVAGQVARILRDLDAAGVRSDRPGEFGERGRDAPMMPGFDAEFVVAAANVLHERVTPDDHAGGVVVFE